jgi:hypothetical protein
MKVWNAMIRLLISDYHFSRMISLAIGIWEDILRILIVSLAKILQVV